MKVNISKSEHKKSFFPISLDSSTSTNFGEVLPLFCHEVVPKSHVSLNIQDAVRFAPLSFPTFGRAYKKVYAFCHSMKDLYPPFDDMLAKTPFTGSTGITYVPNRVPSVPLWFLWLTVLSNCEFSIYKCDYEDIRNFDDSSKSPFLLGNIPFNLCGRLVSDETPDVAFDGSDLACSLPFWLFSTLTNGIGTDDLPAFLNPIFDSNTQLFQRFVNNINNGAPNLDFVFYDPQASNIGSVYCAGADNPNYNGRAAVTFDSADFIYPLLPPDYLYQYNGGQGVTALPISNFREYGEDKSSSYCVCIRLTDSGKLLRKILLGLGYQVCPSDSLVSVLPLYAYFKSYFETFAPKRFIKFEQTYFAKVMNYVVQNGYSFLQAVTSVSNASLGGWSRVVDDLLSCFYTKDTDYYSSQIIGLINDYGSNIIQPYSEVLNDHTNRVSSLQSDVNNNVPPSIDLSGPVAHTQSQQNILSRLTQFINRRSVSGGKIASLLKSVFGISPSAVDDDRNPYLGSYSLDVDFSDVFSTAETSEASLGEYAGKAMAFSHGNENLDYDTEYHSLVIALSVIVPRTQYVQGVNPILSHVNAYDFYNPLFDGLTLLPTRKSSFYSMPILFNSPDVNSFGNQSLFAEYKTKSQGVLSGDLSLRSTRGTYDSFTMDEVISGTSIVQYNADDDNKSGTFSFAMPFSLDFAAGTMWRYLGRWLWLGRFDRIFVNNRINFHDFLNELVPEQVDHDISSTRNLIRTDDNLICHNVIDLKLNSPMIPLAGSYMTDDLYSLNPDGITIQGE